MNKSLSFLCTLSIFFQLNVGNAQSQNLKSQPIVVPNSNLKIKESGFEIYICVLRYRDSIILDMAPLPRQNQYATVNNYRYVGYDFGKPVMMRISQDKISKDDLLNLVSNFKFEFSNGFLYKEFYIPADQKNANKDHNFHLINPLSEKLIYPSFLSFRVEKISLSD
jgi:hypothetical protein